MMGYVKLFLCMCYGALEGENAQVFEDCVMSVVELKF